MTWPTGRCRRSRSSIGSGEAKSENPICASIRLHMPRTISATTAAKRLREVLNAVEHQGETFRIERHGKAIAEVRPTSALGARSRWADVLEALRDGPQPDAGLVVDLEAIRRAAGAVPSNPWARSSTPRS